MRRSGTDQIVVSVEVPRGTQNRMELTVFNCPQMGIHQVDLYVNVGSNLALNSFNLNMVANKTLTDTSCNYLCSLVVQ